jgi:hypothetical protein
MRGTITFESRKGWWFVEEDATNVLYFVHHSHVARARNLHVSDIINFDVAPNPLKPGLVHAINVEWVGRARIEAVRR